MKLYSLSLDRAPAATLIDTTALTWAEALCIGREWDEELDAQRVRAAFVTLAADCDRWPSVKRILAAMPERTQVRLAANRRPEDPQWLKDELAVAREKKAGMDRRRAAGGDFDDDPALHEPPHGESP